MPASVSTRKRIPRAEREPQMLDAATRVFAGRGYHGASMDDIAAGAGVTKPMVYAYFHSKEDLYLRAIEYGGEQLMTALEEAGRGEADLERLLWRRLLAFHTWVNEHRDEWRVLNVEARAGGGRAAEGFARVRARVIELVRQQLLAARRPGEVLDESELEPLAHAMVGTGESLADWYLQHPEQPPEAMAARQMNLMWMGLASLGEGRIWTPPGA
jgi:AcrR family transcriptional regulator